MGNHEECGCLLALFVYCIAMAIAALKIGVVLYVGWLVIGMLEKVCHFLF